MCVDAFMCVLELKFNLDIHSGFVRLQQWAHLLREESGNLENK